MALSVVVFYVGGTLVDEVITHERRESATPFGFADRDLHADALSCLAALRAGGPRLGAAGSMHARHIVPTLAAGLHSVRTRRGEYARVETPAGAVTIESLTELPEALERV